ncbi:MAG TPA: hypothetical protein EYN51_08735 [Flavobacteriales bacterium]|nr:hypothetical protein [Flavobacteriales bacterium]
MKVANQKSKFQNKSDSFKEVHQSIKGVYVKNLNKTVRTNKQICILDPIKEGTAPQVSPEDITIDFGVM